MLLSCQSTGNERLILLSNVFVLDAAPNIQDVDQSIAGELFWAVERRHLEAFRQYLEGWWFRRAIVHLQALLPIEFSPQNSTRRSQICVSNSSRMRYQSQTICSISDQTELS